MTRLDVAWGAATDAGVRELNEDAYLAEFPVFVVADGMGGHNRGEVAARSSIDAFRALTGQAPVQPADVARAIVAAGERVRALGDGPTAPGSTLTGVALTDQSGLPYWLVFNLGDSRTYRCHDGRLEQITVDHSLAQELRSAGKDTAAAQAPRNVITRALGGGRRDLPTADQWLLPAGAGDRILLCTDGVVSVVPDEQLADVLATHPDPQPAAAALVAAALEAGSDDNVTVVVVQAFAVAGDPAPVVDSTIPSEYLPRGARDE